MGVSSVQLHRILKDAGVRSEYFEEVRTQSLHKFYERSFHQEINTHSKNLYATEHYFQAVFEACKAYEQGVIRKAKLEGHGVRLMEEAWDKKGPLDLKKSKSRADANIQEGIKSLSIGLMQAIRNPGGHKLSEEWPISQEDCLNILSFLTFLFQKLDEARHVEKVAP